MSVSYQSDKVVSPRDIPGMGCDSRDLRLRTGNLVPTDWRFSLICCIRTFWAQWWLIELFLKIIGGSRVGLINSRLSLRSRWLRALLRSRSSFFVHVHRCSFSRIGAGLSLWATGSWSRWRRLPRCSRSVGPGSWVTSRSIEIWENDRSNNTQFVKQLLFVNNNWQDTSAIVQITLEVLDIFMFSWSPTRALVFMCIQHITKLPNMKSNDT